MCELWVSQVPGEEVGALSCKTSSNLKAHTLGHLPEPKRHTLWVAAVAITKDWWVNLTHLGQSPRMSRELYQSPVKLLKWQRGSQDGEQWYLQCGTQGGNSSILQGSVRNVTSQTIV